MPGTRSRPRAPGNLGHQLLVVGDLASLEPFLDLGGQSLPDAGDAHQLPMLDHFSDIDRQQRDGLRSPPVSPDLGEAFSPLISSKVGDLLQDRRELEMAQARHSRLRSDLAIKHRGQSEDRTAKD